MADPQQKSLEVPYLLRMPTLWHIPQWGMANQWRWFVYNQPIAMLCRQKLINYLLGIPWEIVARDPDSNDKYKEDCHYYTAWVLRNFDNICDLCWQDTEDLPIGGNLEIIRWPEGVKPDIREGGETYRVTGDHPKGHPFELVNIDGATLFPTYNDDLPMAQRIPELDKIVYFKPAEIGRIGIQPRTEMRLKGYYKAPPEQIYLAIQMVNHGDHYYSDLLRNVPPVGILDLIDMQQQSATEWAESNRVLFTGDDAFKMPVLYEHEKPAVFIPFGKSPQELLFDTASLRYARITASSYGLTLGNLGLEPKGESLAGSIRDDMQAETGYGFVVEKTKGLLDEQILPPYLEWQPKIQNYEKLKGRAQAMLVFTQGLKIAKEAGFILPSEGQAMLKREGFLTIEVEEPDDEAFKKQQEMGLLGKPGQNGFGNKAKELTDKVPPAQGGRGEITGKALTIRAYVDARPLMTQPVKKGLDRIAAQATPNRLRKIAKSATAAIFDHLTAKADTWEDELDKIIEAEKWYLLPPSLLAALSAAYKAAFSNGAQVAIDEVIRLLPDLAIGLDFELTNPRTLAQLEDKAAILIRRIDDGTRFYIKRALVKGVEEGMSSPQIAQLIKEGAGVDKILGQAGFADDVVSVVKAELEGLTDSRLASIVNTEVNRAESEGRLKQWGEMGLTRKQWIHTGPDSPCPEFCGPNQALGLVPMDHVFDDAFGGTQTPPGHPGECHCHLAFDEGELISKAGTLKVWDGS